MGTLQLHRRIMRRVRYIYLLRKVFNPVALRAYSCAVLVLITATLVSMSNIFANVPAVTDMNAFYGYVSYAFMHTELIVQILTVGIVVITLYLLRDIARPIFQRMSLQRV
jgi:hypothetical protein